MRILACGAIVSMESDEEYPQLVKLESMQRQFALPAPDCIYHTAPLNGKHSYTLSGQRGTARIFEIEIWTGHVGDLANFRFYSRLDSLNAVENGKVQVKLSSNMQNGNWVKLPEGECTLVVRNYFYDWDKEQTSMLSIERDGALFPPPPLSREKLEWKLERTLSWLNINTKITRASALQHLDSSPDEMQVQPVDYGFTKICYPRGYFRCKEDEAVILEVKPPKTVFWHFMLTNLQWEALDYHLRQTSLNGHQAFVDPDGVFRAVISHKDPGVANWLDAGGHQLGLIAGRYYAPDSKPVPTLKRVKLSDLWMHLPKGTKSVTAEERQEILRQRMRSMTHRFCGD